MNYLIKVCLVAMTFSLAGCMRHRTDEISLPNGYAITKTSIGNDTTRSQITRTIQNRKVVIAEWVSENGMVLSIMPTPTSASGLIKSSYFIPYEFGDNNPECRIELVQEDITVNGTDLDLPAFARIIDKLKSFAQGSPVLTVTLPIRETQFIDVVRLITAYAGNGLAIFQHSYEGAKVTAIERQGKLTCYFDKPIVRSENAVLNGLRWLVANQNKDGSWGEKTDEIKGSTGLALLAFLGHGETLASSEDYGQTIKEGFKFLIADMQAANRITQTSQPSAIGHAIATWALCEGFEMMKIPALQSPAEEGLAGIVRGQRSSGLWDGNYRQADGEDDVEASIWQFIALISGLKMDSKANGLQSSLERASKAMEKVLESKPDPGTTAGALLCLQLWGKAKNPICRSALTTLDTVEPDWEKPAFTDPLFRWHLLTHAFFKERDKSWVRWNRAYAPMLTERQQCVREGDQVMGYWDSPGTGERFGRVYSTAMAILTLEIYYRYLPIFMPFEQQEDSNSSTNDVVIKIE